MEEYSDLYEQYLEEITSKGNAEIVITVYDGMIEFELDDTKNIISTYKENLESLDDCIFISVMEELSNYNVDVKEFDELLNKEELTDSEKEYASELIKFTNSLIHKHIEEKIEELKDLIDIF